MKRILLTGISGVGTSTVTDELAARGYKAVDADGDEYSTSAEISDELASAAGSPVEPDRDWIWREDRISELLSTEDADVLFVDVPTSRLTKWVFSSVHAVDRTPCPSVCIASTSRPVLWTLDPSADREAEAAEAVAKLLPRKKEVVARWRTAWA